MFAGAIRRVASGGDNPIPDMDSYFNQPFPAWFWWTWGGLLATLGVLLILLLIIAKRGRARK